MNVWTFHLEAVTLSPNKMMKMHWTEYQELLNDWFMRVRAKWGVSSVTKATGRRRVDIVRYGSRPLDPDNLTASVKPLVDILRPAKVERGIYKAGTAKAGQPWTRSRLGLGFIVDDSEAMLDLHVSNGKLTAGQKPYTLLTISDIAV